MAAFGELAELPHPQPVAQAGAALGQPHVGRLAVGERDPPGLELVLGPGRAGVFVVAQTLPKSPPAWRCRSHRTAP